MIYTFYSFKGGVGRSMAMANIGDCLARRGLRVLMIDFDLEAPGLERYFKRLDVSAALRNPGVMDLIAAFKRAMASGEDLSQAEFRQIERYLFPVYPEQGGSRLDLMTAGRRLPDDEMRSYALAVRTFEWQDFYFNWEGEAFFEWLRKTLVGPEGRYDVVLADSRTGVTEMGGICAYQLADVVVMMTAANRQNVEGTRRVADDFRSPQVLDLRRGRPLQLLV
ncbi:MAG: AAA family ATPase, partial [Rhodocyclaceae bacterium]|nr:AAA family ATPase [Rhodocyclaceae bacterium]